MMILNFNKRKNVNKLILLIVIMLGCMFCIPGEIKAETGDGHKIMVSMGDSYSSGEGLGDYYDDDKELKDKVKSYEWLAHRSRLSWPGRLMLDGEKKMADEGVKDYYWYFTAVSGAETKHMLSTQEKEYDKDDWGERYKGVEHLPPQCDVFSKLGNNKADYITLTLGGNDAGFAGTIKAAATGSADAEDTRKNNFVLETLTDSAYINFSGLRDRINETWKRFYASGGIKSDMLRAYEDISNKAGSQAKIIVAGYPKLLSAEGYGALFSKTEATIINNAVHNFNYEIEKMVEQCKKKGMKICFVPVEKEFEGHEAYSDMWDPEDESKRSYINRVEMVQEEDLLSPRISKLGQSAISAASIHPNDEGARVYADCVQDKIDLLEADDGESEWSANNIGKTNERDVVLTLDVSGSMDGMPLDETKKAATKFVNTVLKNSSNIGVVSYSSESTLLSPFTMNEKYLVETLKNMDAEGDTNIEDGLKTSYNMLKSSNAKKKIIVLMSDGEPNVGKTGEELIEYANQLKEEGILIYTLGFFESLNSEKSEAQFLMEQIASEGCHYEVASADDLIFSFEDMAEQLNGQKYIYVRIACPVDVSVSHNGEKLNSNEEKLSTRTDFGTLTFEEEKESDEEDEEESDNVVKVLRLKEGEDYDIKIRGTGEGSMDYTIGYMDDNGEYTDMRNFEGIDITEDTIIDTVADDSNTTVLNVDEDGDGKYDKRYRAMGNEEGELVDFTYIRNIALCTTIAVSIIMYGMIWKIKRKKHQAV